MEAPEVFESSCVTSFMVFPSARPSVCQGSFLLVLGVVWLQLPVQGR